MKKQPSLNVTINYSTQNSSNPPIRKPYSWALIILLIIIFFPAGFYLLYKQLTYRSDDVKNNIKNLRITSAIVFAVGLLYLMMSVTGSMDTTSGTASANPLFVLLTCVIISAAFLFPTLKMKKKDSKYSLYRNIIAQKTTSIRAIAEQMQVDYETALYDLKYMIETGRLPGVTIDEIGGELILPVIPQRRTALEWDEYPSAVTCENCGATNEVKRGESNQCEYCGSSLNEMIKKEIESNREKASKETASS